jgi:hypothetical protein
MWQGWITLVLGMWLLFSLFISSLQTPLNLIIIGILAAVSGFWSSKNWQGWVNGILGLWILLSGSVFNLAFSWNFIISGILLILLGFWRGILPTDRMKPPQDRKNWTVLED